MTRNAEHTPSHQSVIVPFIRLTAHEVQSGHDRQKWAEGLILQLPENHDGRNSWLINYGETDEASAKRSAWNDRARKDGREPSCVFNEDTRSTGTAAPAPSSLAGGVSLPERLRFAEIWDLDADQSARDRCGVLMLEAAEALERAALSPEAPAREGGVSRDALADWLVMRERQSTDAAQQHIEKAPAKHFCAGKASAFREVASVLWNSPEWFAALTPRHEAPAEGAGERLLRHVGSKPSGCYCPPDRCDAPVIMGRQTPCIRARSSAPEAREAVARVVSAHGDPEAFGEREIEVLTDLSRIPYNTSLYTHPAAPSADKLRIAVEALEPFRKVHDVVRSKPGAYILTGAAGITVSDVRRADQALVALKAEGA